MLKLIKYCNKHGIEFCIQNDTAEDCEDLMYIRFKKGSKVLRKFYSIKLYEDLVNDHMLIDHIIALVKEEFKL